MRQFTLSYDGVIDRVSSHIVMIMVGRDYAGGVLREEPALLGALRQGQTSILVDRGPGSLWRGFLGAVRLGMHHIAEGYDHLLFLLALLLPAPLLAAGGRWTGHRDTRSMVRKLAAIITAFTVGHSLTLLGGAFLGWTLPTQPVEIAIALSILISAIHAWRPLFAGREMFVAGGFGLIHGLAFATTISAFALDPFHKAQAILGFNLGIELVQLGIILVLLTLLIWFGRRPLYQRVRAALALPAGILAILWMIERIAGVSIIPG